MEGLATFSRYDHSTAMHHADEDWDLYLAGHYRENLLMMHHWPKARDLPPLVAPSMDLLPADPTDPSIWAGGRLVAR